MPSPIFLSRPPTGFSVLAVLRGIQLTYLGAVRALKNPCLSSSRFYRRAAGAIAMSILIQLLLQLPILILRFLLWGIVMVASESFIEQLASSIDTLEFVENSVLNVGVFLACTVRFTRSDMDDLFLISLRYVDGVYQKEHPDSRRQYYVPLQNYQGVDGIRHNSSEDVLKDSHLISWVSEMKSSLLQSHGFRKYLQRYLRSCAITLGIYLLSALPIVGPSVMPIVSFYCLNKVAGTPVALGVFCVAFSIKRKDMIVLLSTLWGGRALVWELLSPYFLRVPFSRSDKDHWFKAREGILLGFGCGFFWLMKIPFAGVIVYAIAEASTAYLITKVSEPPPAYGPLLFKWVENEVLWTTQDKFLSGETLNNDGFGQAIPIVPSDW